MAAQVAMPEPEGTCNDRGHGQAAGTAPYHHVGKADKLTGKPALTHKDTGQHKEENGQHREGIQRVVGCLCDDVQLQKARSMYGESSGKAQYYGNGNAQNHAAKQ